MNVYKCAQMCECVNVEKLGLNVYKCVQIGSQSRGAESDSVKLIRCASDE